MSRMAVVVWPYIVRLSNLYDAGTEQQPPGFHRTGRRWFACAKKLCEAKREASWRASIVARRVSCIPPRTARKEDFLAYGWQLSTSWFISRCGHFHRDNNWDYHYFYVTASWAAYCEGAWQSEPTTGPNNHVYPHVYALYFVLIAINMFHHKIESRQTKDRYIASKASEQKFFATWKYFYKW